MEKRAREAVYRIALAAALWSSQFFGFLQVYAAVPIKNSSMNGFRGTRRISMYLLTEWEGQTGKYLARGHDVPTKRSEVRVS